MGSFKDNHRAKVPSSKTPVLTKKYQDQLAHQINSLQEVLKQKQNFQKSKVVTGKTPFFVIFPFCAQHFICLNIGLTVLYGNHAFSILVLLTKKWYFSFLKKVFFFQKICFRVKACVRYFLWNFHFSSNDSLSKAMKNIIYFI